MFVIPVMRATYRSKLRDAGQTAALGGLLLMLAGMPGYVVLQAWRADQAMIRAWTIVGPPCPVVARPDRMTVGSKPPKAFDYGGIGFARHFGHASCVAWRDGDLRHSEITRVCQFNAPGAVTVASGGKTISYQPGVARRATVIIRNGQPSCVMAGWFAA